MGPSDFTSRLRGSCAADFYRLQKSIAFARFKLATFEFSGKNTNHFTTEAMTLNKPFTRHTVNFDVYLDLLEDSVFTWQKSHLPCV
jgi:hypothetical protein